MIALCWARMPWPWRWWRRGWKEIALLGNWLTRSREWNWCYCFDWMIGFSLVGCCCRCSMQSKWSCLLLLSAENEAPAIFASLLTSPFCETAVSPSTDRRCFVRTSTRQNQSHRGMQLMVREIGSSTTQSQHKSRDKVSLYSIQHQS